MAQHVLYSANYQVCTMGTISQVWGLESEWCLVEDIPQSTIKERNILNSSHLWVIVWIPVLYVKGKEC